MIKKITSLCLPVAIFILFVGMSEFTFAAGPVENAVPSWDRKIPGDKRFLGVLLVKVKFSNGLMADIPTAAYDSETGLVWELVLDTDEVFWWKAKANCYNKIRGERKGWRLPTIEELASLVDPTAIGGPRAGDLALPVGHPFHNVQGEYWSSTTGENPNAAERFALTIDFTNGNVVGRQIEIETKRLWCVRGGQGYDGQVVH